MTAMLAPVLTLRTSVRRTLVQQALAILAKYGSAANLYLPGVGAINGITAGNWLDSIGTPYGWLDLLSFLLPFRVSWSGSDFCSEVVAAALGLDKPWHTSPGDLWDWAVQQPGARAVPEDELRTPWSAHT